MHGIHLGASGYKQTARNFHISADDFNWNLKYIPVVNEMLRVSSRDYADARSILNWDRASGSLVSASEGADRMNEYNTHYNWARRIVLRAERYGTKP